jgi:hypothetical protein
MRHIVFILAHKNLNQVMRMAKYLSTEFDCLIHMDSRFGDLKSVRKYMTYNNIYFTTRRLRIDLASFSMIEVIKVFLEEAKTLENQNQIKYSYAVLISGQCYPIKKASWIKKTLDTNYPNLIMDTTHIENLQWLESVYSRHRFIRIHNLVNKNIKFNLINRLLKYPLYLFELVFTFFNRTPIFKANSINLNIHGGSAWWILPVGLIEDVFSIFDNTKVLKRIYTHILTPEEHFFQTMISTYFSDQYKFDSKFQDGPSQVYFEHPKYGKSTDGHPFVLRSGDLKLLMESDRLFARKFDNQVDEVIIDKIENFLL